MTSNAPANLQQLIDDMSREAGGPSSEAPWSFSNKQAGIDLSEKAGKRFFVGGNYSLAADPDIARGMETSGQQVLDYAKQKGFKITDLPEFKNIDFDGNGSVSAKEVGAVMLAASLSPRGGQFKDEIGGTFDNKLSPKDMAALLSPETGQAIKDIASKLLQDNGVHVTNPQTSDQAVDASIKAGAPVMRC